MVELRRRKKVERQRDNREHWERSEERARNPKEQQVKETSRTTPQPKERTVQRTVTPQEEGKGQERERERERRRR